MKADIINSDVMKKNNRNEILRLIRSEPCSRVSLAKKTGLTRAAISFICEEMIKDGLIIEGDKVQSDGGRPAIELKINPNFGVVCGVYINRNHYYVGIVDFSGNVLNQKEGVTDGNNCPKTLNSIANDLTAMLDGGVKIIGIGVTAPGPLSKVEGVLNKVPNFPNWQGVNIKEFFEKRLNTQCVLDNTSNALARAEYYLNTECLNKYLEIIIDSGLGSAVANVQNGLNLLECELGHTTIDAFGQKCDCGNIGCAELYVNEKKFYGNKKEKTNFFKALSSVIVNAVNAFNVNQVIFSSSMIKDFESFRNTLKEELINKNKAEVIITKSVLGNKEIFVASNLMLSNLNI